MEFENIFMSLFGLLGLVSWIIINSSFFKKTQVYIGKNYIKKIKST